MDGKSTPPARRRGRNPDGPIPHEIRPLKPPKLPPRPHADAEVGTRAAEPRAAAATRAMLILRNMMISSGLGMCVPLHPVALAEKTIVIVHPRPLLQITLSTLARPAAIGVSPSISMKRDRAMRGTPAHPNRGPSASGRFRGCPRC